MRKPALALFLTASMTLVLLMDLGAALALASGHRPYVVMLVVTTATLPGFVIAGLAWFGKLPSAGDARARGRR